MATQRPRKRREGRTKRRSRPSRKKPVEKQRDPVESAEAVGLCYVSDTMPGIRRRKTGTGFSYVGPDGRPIKDRAALQRIRSLAIPPAYTDVWICPIPHGIYRLPAGTPVAASSSAIIPGGGRYETRPNLAGCSPSAVPCRASAAGFRVT